jgi:glycosyltransferase involved in cell wall biosynthesis
MRIAFIHDWLVDKGGSENVLSAMLEQWPHAPVYTLVHDHQGPTRSLLNGHTVITSFLQKLPQATRRYRSFLPLMPIAIEQFDLSAFDIVISSSHAVAKGVIIGPDQLHISYVHSPIRYAWELQFQYLREAGLDHGLKSVLVRWLLHYIRLWDTRTANGVDEFVCNSRFVARRIWKVYHRKATVIYPPVDVDKFELCEQKENFYLTASRMVPYKRINLIVEAFAKMSDKRLFVIGNGPDFDKIKAIATPNVILMGYQPLEVLREKMQKAKAFIFAAEEDFGIVPVEAQACGTPVIAFGKGGALETIVNEKTGLFFEEQSVESLLDAISRFETKKMEFSPYEIRKNAERFSKARFQEEFTSFVNQKWQDFEQRKKSY